MRIVGRVRRSEGRGAPVVPTDAEGSFMERNFSAFDIQIGLGFWIWARRA